LWLIVDVIIVQSVVIAARRLIVHRSSLSGFCAVLRVHPHVVIWCNSVMVDEVDFEGILVEELVITMRALDH
jgi:hypothetical protein